MRRCTTWLVVCIALTVADGCAAPVLSAPQEKVRPPKRVLLLHSLGPQFPPWNTIAISFRQQLRDQSPYSIDLYEASLQSDRFGPPEGEGPFIDYLHAIFAERGLDLVVSLGAPAARFFLQNRPKIFPSTPLIIAAADERTFSETDLSNMDTAVAVRFDEGEQIEEILRLLPQTTDIAMVMGDSPSEQFWVEPLRRSLEPFARRVTFRWLNKLSAYETVKAVRELPAHSAIYYATVRVDAQGVPQDGDRMFGRIRDVAQAPIFSYVDNHFGEGVVGGPLLSSREIAQRTAAVASRILGGETASDIKTPTVRSRAPIYDWRELQRWSISEALLPPGSIVRFREPAMLERYRLQIAALGGALLLQMLLILWLLREHRHRRLAEAESLQRVNELARMNRFATAGELAASIAHELRQPLSAVVISATEGLNWIKRQMPTPDINAARTAIERAVEQSHRADDVIKGVGAMFRKDTQERKQVNVNELVEQVLAIESGSMKSNNVLLDADLTKDGPPVVLADPVQLQQVILNVVMNAVEAMRHSANENRVLQIRTEAGAGDTVAIAVRDSGPGLDPGVAGKIFEPFYTTKPGGMGMGLSICRTIVKAHGGSLTAVRVEPHGMEFQVVLPRYKQKQSETFTA